MALGGDVVRDLDVATHGKPRDNEQFGDSVLGIRQLATELEVYLLGHRLALIIEVRHDVFHGCSLVFFWKMIQKIKWTQGEIQKFKGSSYERFMRSINLVPSVGRCCSDPRLLTGGLQGHHCFARPPNIHFIRSRQPTYTLATDIYI